MTDQTSTEPQRSSRVARFVEITDVNLIALRAELLVNHQVILSAPGLHLAQEMAHEYAFGAEQKRLVVQIDATFRLLRENDKLDTAVFLLRCKHVLGYHFFAEGGPPLEERDAYFTAFAKINATFNAWPYMRELLQTTAGRMGLPPVILPVLRTGAYGPLSVPDQKLAPRSQEQSARVHRNKK